MFVQGLFDERTCMLNQRTILDQIAKLQRRTTALIGAEKFSRAAQFQIFFRHFEPIGGLLHDFQSRFGFGSFRARQQYAVGLFRAAPMRPRN